MPNKDQGREDKYKDITSIVICMKEMKSLVIALLVAICNGQSTSKGGTRNELSSGIQTIQKELLLLRTELIKSKVGIQVSIPYISLSPPTRL